LLLFLGFVSNTNKIKISSMTIESTKIITATVTPIDNRIGPIQKAPK